MPSTSPFKNLFGRNPFSALQEHMRAAVGAVEVVPELFKALAEGDQAAVEKAKDRICELEGEADRVKNELRDHLPRGLFLPVNRRDLLEVLDMQDSMADTAEDIAGLLFERQMTIPSGMEEPLLTFVDRCVSVSRYAARIIEELDEPWRRDSADVTPPVLKRWSENSTSRKTKPTYLRSSSPGLCSNWKIRSILCP